ncbi:MAG: phenylacetate-CoA oxygenase subunit PaaJ [Betaproteobacteria bacterium]|nr:phenylacetate-CoA oxygenase subunit PaaJ [Betaproteobacteria bacterium]
MATIRTQGLPGTDEPEARAWAVLHQVLDPEVPALSVCDLGIVRELRFEPAAGLAVEPAGPSLDGQLTVWLTPTYSGCPATEAIEAAVRDALRLAGFQAVQTVLRRAPAWTTDWISAQGRAKLKAYGIAPPAHVQQDLHGAVPIRIVRPDTVACPRCDSRDTERLSAFGSTACKALYRCRACREPFEHFKPI